MAGQNVLNFSDSSFDGDVLKSDIPVLVDFWATWCGPCRAIAPVVDQIATEYAGRLKVGKVDIDAHGDIATRYGISSIPTLLLFKEGRVVDSRVGAVGKSELLKMLEPHVSSD